MALARAIRRRGTTLRRAYDTLNRLVADEAVAIHLPGVDDLPAFISEMAEYGVRVELRAPPTAVDVRAIRDALALTQAEFAARFGFQLDTVQNWEQGRNTPDASTRTLLRLIERNPEVVEAVLREATEPATAS